MIGRPEIPPRMLGKGLMCDDRVLGRALVPLLIEIKPVVLLSETAARGRSRTV